jgi:hypothetical protein
MHSIMHKISPPILHNQLKTNAERNQNMELRNANDLYIPTASSEQVNKMPLFVFPRLWNTLPDNKLHRNPVLFKTLLREYLWSCIDIVPDVV